MSNWLAFDIGGANLKAADGLGYVDIARFPLWSDPDSLHHHLRSMIADAPLCDRIAITMTGELADCFASKSAGVDHILKEVERAADGRHTRVYLTSGKFVTPAAARLRPLETAASNWRAMSQFALRFVNDRPALLIDIGSTTCDFIPLRNGEVAATGATDTQRLLSGELLYTGVERSPVCGIVMEVKYRGQTCPVAQEFFAQTLDAYLLLGMISEAPLSTATADGKPATRVAARTRIGRMICADDTEFHHRDAVQIATQIGVAQCARVIHAMKKLVATLPVRPEVVVTSGRGEFLARQALRKVLAEAEVVSLNRKLNKKVSRCATAHALAVLARESLGN